MKIRMVKVAEIRIPHPTANFTQWADFQWGTKVNLWCCTGANEGFFNDNLHIKQTLTDEEMTRLLLEAETD